jgi:ATP-dependent Clp protease adapter protein ClpS
MERLTCSQRPNVVEAPTPQTGGPDSGSGEGWIVTVYNNDVNTDQEVIHILMVATSCDLAEAEMETWEVHNLGKSVVHHADKQECENVAAVIAQIGIEVRVSCE